MILLIKSKNPKQLKQISTKIRLSEHLISLNPLKEEDSQINGYENASTKGRKNMLFRSSMLTQEKLIKIDYGWICFFKLRLKCMNKAKFMTKKETIII